jgi:hypothetical protein
MCTGSGCITVSQTFPTVQELCCGDVTGGAPAITMLLTSTYCPEQVQNTKRTGLDPKLLSIYTLSTCCNYHGVRCLSTHTRHPCVSTRQRCNAAGASCANGMPHSNHTTASGSAQQLRLASTAAQHTTNTKTLYKHTELQSRPPATHAALALAACSRLRKDLWILKPTACCRCKVTAWWWSGAQHTHWDAMEGSQPQPTHGKWFRSSRRTWPGSPGHPRLWTEPALRSLQDKQQRHAEIVGDNALRKG